MAKMLQVAAAVAIAGFVAADVPLPAATASLEKIPEVQPRQLLTSNLDHIRGGVAELFNANPGQPPTSAAGSRSGTGTSTTTHTSVFGEIKAAGTRALVGLFLFFFGFPVLWFNESREAKMWKLFGRAALIAQPDVDSNAVDEDHDCCLVHVPGETSTEDTLQDADFGVSVSNCAKLKREVQMFQWVEKASDEESDTNTGGKDTTTKYTYNQEWSSDAVDSSSFKQRGYSNPPFLLKQKDLKANVSLGAFRLPENMVGKMCAESDLTDAELPGSANVVGKQFARQGSAYCTMQNGQPPQIGDYKVTFQKVPCGDATVLAVQDGETFAPLKHTSTIDDGKVVLKGRARRGDSDSDSHSHSDSDESLLKQYNQAEDLMTSNSSCVCCSMCGLIGSAVESKMEVYHISEQRLTLKESFEEVKGDQKLIHILLQVVGFLMLFIGLSMVFALVPAFFRLIPFIGKWIQLFGNFLASCAAFLIAGFCWCMTVALAWLFMRPAKAILMLCVAAACIAIPTVLANKYASQ